MKLLIIVHGIDVGLAVQIKSDFKKKLNLIRPACLLPYLHLTLCLSKFCSSSGRDISLFIIPDV